MATGITKLSNLVNPEVMSAIIEQKYVDYMKFAPLATIDTTLQGQPGDRITLPHFNYIGDAATLAEAIALDPEKLTASSVTVPVHKIAKGIELSDEALISGYGDPLGEAANQIALSIASQEDNEMLDAVDAMDKEELEALIKKLNEKMGKAAAELNFELAADYRDQVIELKETLRDM